MSQKITPQEAIDWMDEFRSNNPGITRADGEPINGYSFNPQHILDVATGLDPSTDEFFIGLAKREDGNHCLVVCGVKVERDDHGAVTKKVILYNDQTQPIYDFGEPCPDNCPNTWEEI
jgi:hypothetical protein